MPSLLVLNYVVEHIQQEEHAVVVVGVAEQVAPFAHPVEQAKNLQTAFLAEGFNIWADVTRGSSTAYQ